MSDTTYYRFRIEALEKENKRLETNLKEARELLAEIKLVLEKFNVPVPEEGDNLPKEL